ncbi:MAG: hypothetical protein JHD16_17680, partial [Solirubrobacteraceae bacterium]|nr:hypothetical protein [Solirubrobacteraceae bacterium]
VARIRVLLLMVVGALAAVFGTEAAAQARACTPLALGAAAHEGTWDDAKVDCFSIDVAVRASGSTRLLLSVKNRSAKLVLKTPAGAQVCAHQWERWIPVLAWTCDVSESGVYTLDVEYGLPAPGGNPQTYGVAVQNESFPERCRELGDAPREPIRESLPGPATECFGFRVGPWGLLLQNESNGVSSWLVDQNGGQSCRVRDSGTCVLKPGRYSMVAQDYGSDAWGRPSELRFGFVPLGRRACAEITQVDWSSSVAGEFSASEVDCYLSPMLRAGEKYVLAGKTSVGAIVGRRIRRPDGSTLCSSTTTAALLCSVDADGLHTVETWPLAAPTGNARRPYTLSLQRVGHPAGCKAAVAAQDSWSGTRRRSGDPAACYVFGVPQEGLVFEQLAGTSRVRVFTATNDTTQEVCVDRTAPCRLANNTTHYAYAMGPAGRWHVSVENPANILRPPTCKTSASGVFAHNDVPVRRVWNGSDRDCVRFYGTEGAWIAASIAWSGSALPGKRLLKADGTQVCRGGKWAPLLCRLPASGLYYLESWGNAGTSSDAHTPHHVSIRRFDLNSSGQPVEGCETHYLWDKVKSFSGKRGRSSDNVRCHQVFHNYLPWVLRLTPGQTTMRVVDENGDVICGARPGTETSRCPVGSTREYQPQPAFVFVYDGAGDYSASFTTKLS